MSFSDKMFAYLRPALMVPTPREIRIDVWWVGVLHRCIQAAAAAYFGWSLLGGNTWAKWEFPQPNVNSYALPSVDYTNANRAYVDSTKTPLYCNNASYDFSSSNDPEWFWQYSAAECQALDWQEVFEKDPLGAIFITTAYIEEAIYGYPCTDGPQSAAAMACAGTGSGAVLGNVRVDGNQCMCTMKKTVTPIGPEELQLGFGHGYNAFAYGGVSGNNQERTGGVYNTQGPGETKPINHALDTRVLYYNFTDKQKPWADPVNEDKAHPTYAEFGGGETITSFSIKKWLAAVGHATARTRGCCLRSSCC